MSRLAGALPILGHALYLGQRYRLVFLQSTMLCPHPASTTAITAAVQGGSLRLHPYKPQQGLLCYAGSGSLTYRNESVQSCRQPHNCRTGGSFGRLRSSSFRAEAGASNPRPCKMGLSSLLLKPLMMRIPQPPLVLFPCLQLRRKSPRLQLPGDFPSSHLRSSRSNQPCSIH